MRAICLQATTFDYYVEHYCRLNDNANKGPLDCCAAASDSNRLENLQSIIGSIGWSTIDNFPIINRMYI